MITPRIEKAILSGWATYQKVNHAFGSFGSVTIPKGHTVIILDVKYNHFWNPLKNESLTLAEIFKYSEYTLKIDGKKSLNYLIFKNIMDFKLLDPTIVIDVNEPISTYSDNFLKYFFPIHSQPIQQDVFFVCENYINLTVSRNEFINRITTDYTTLNPKANQQNTPQGLGNLNVLKTFKGNSITGTPFNYQPPNRVNAQTLTLAVENQTMESYTQPLDVNSVFGNPENDKNYLYYNYPLIEIGYIIFNNNDFDKIATQ